MISIIVAVAENNAIGRGNELLWHLKGDLKYFKSTTLGHPVIMGRKTFVSIGRPLPGRRNIIVSRNTLQLSDNEQIIRQDVSLPTQPANSIVNKNTNASFEPTCGIGQERTSVEWVQDLDNLLITVANDPVEYFVIGGASVYMAALPYATKLYITKIYASAPEADAFFPKINPAKWHITTRSPLQHNDENNIDYEFQVYTNNSI